MVTLPRSWPDITKLPQVAQDDPAWLEIRKHKQSSSDFAAVVPMTKEYIGHIVEMWKYPQPFAYNSSKTCYDALTYQDYILKKASPSSVCAGEPELRSADAQDPMQIGKRYEPIIRNYTSQIVGRVISELGWIEEQRVKNAGVSPDGLVHCDTRLTSTTSDCCLLRHFMNLTIPGAKNFEAKTIVSRPMVQRIPIKYHIQIERTCYELGLQSCLYTEAQFLELSERDWSERSASIADILPMGVPLQYGILLVCMAQVNDVRWWDGKVYKALESWHVWPHAFIRSPAQAKDWRKHTCYKINKQYGPEITVSAIFFQLENAWTVEVPLWKDYERVYGPLIQREAAFLAYLTQTKDGQKEYLTSFALPKAKQFKNRVREPRKHGQKLFTEDMQDLIAHNS